jgi:DNA-binding response OmpR family regulator
MSVILLTRDLAVVSQVDGAAARVGAAVRSVTTESDAVESGVAEKAGLIVVDLGMPSLNVKAIVEKFTSAMATRPRIVAFGSHVHVEKLTAARDAGCDEVISRGQFFSQLDAVLGGAVQRG